jgi:hypothetical protein
MGGRRRTVAAAPRRRGGASWHRRSASASSCSGGSRNRRACSGSTPSTTHTSSSGTGTKRDRPSGTAVGARGTSAHASPSKRRARLAEARRAGDRHEQLPRPPSPRQGVRPPWVQTPRSSWRPTNRRTSGCWRPTTVRSPTTAAASRSSYATCSRTGTNVDAATISDSPITQGHRGQEASADLEQIMTILRDLRPSPCSPATTRGRSVLALVDNDHLGRVNEIPERWSPCTTERQDSARRILAQPRTFPRRLPRAEPGR